MNCAINNSIKTQWTKPFLTLAILGFFAWFLPEEPIDRWNLLNPNKMAKMFFSLVFIQVFGSIMNHILDSRTGAILTGFLGGLISSTATAVSVAKKSKLNLYIVSSNRIDFNSNAQYNQVLMYLSSTAAMLIEGALIVLSGTSRLHLSSFVIFVSPLMTTVILIIYYSRKMTSEKIEIQESSFKVLPLLNLSMFIILILGISKLLQNVFGQSGLMILTFLVSLFEIHGSVIANVQLHENNEIPLNLLGHLIVISIIASYISKIFIIWMLGSRQLLFQALKCTAFLFLSLILGWTFFV